MLGGIDCMTSQGAGTTVLCQSAICFSQFYLSKAVFIYKVSCPLFMPSPCVIPSLQSTFYTDHFLIILVILVILAIQVITIFLEITIVLYQCCQSYLKSSRTCCKVTIKISSRELFAIWITISLHSGNSTKTALIRIKDKILIKMDSYELKGLVLICSFP